MVRDLLLRLLSILLILLALPFLAVSFVIAALCAAVAAAFPRFRRPARSQSVPLKRLNPVDEFEFERALDAYEQLIVTHAWKKP